MAKALFYKDRFQALDDKTLNRAVVRNHKLKK